MFWKLTIIFIFNIPSLWKPICIFYQINDHLKIYFYMIFIILSFGFEYLKKLSSDSTKLLLLIYHPFIFKGTVIWLFYKSNAKCFDLRDATTGSFHIWIIEHEHNRVPTLVNGVPPWRSGSHPQFSSLPPLFEDV